MMEKLREATEQVRRWQIQINGIYALEGQPAPYDIDEPVVGTTRASAPKYGPTTFAHRPLATAVRQVLEDTNGATDDQIFDALMQGGFDGFGTKDEQAARHALKTSLGKNTAFKRLPNGYFVLDKKRPYARSKSSVGGDVQEEADGVEGTEEGGAQDVADDQT
jgi:hypothetical protein